MQEEEEEEDEDEEQEEVHGKVSVSYDADVTEEHEQRIETIKEANAKRAARRAELRNKKPNV